MTTELAQRMKAAALNATPGRIGDRIDGTGSIKYQCFGNDGSLVLQTDHKNMEFGFIGPNSKADELFFRECSPENVLVLVEALESRDKRNAELNSTLERWAVDRAQSASELEAAEKRNAELEARTVKLPQRLQPGADGYDDWYVHSADDGEYLKADDVIAALDAAGVAVEG